ncbi:MAG: DUF1127 domain-containing protein [Kiloniellales bacterium]
MNLWFLSNPEMTSSLLAGRQARNDAIARVSTLTVAAANRLVVTIAGAAVAWSRALLRAIERDTERRRSIAALRGLDQRMLRDMGIDRSEIMGVVEGRLHRRAASLAELRGLPRPRPGRTAAAPATQGGGLPKAA